MNTILTHAKEYLKTKGMSNADLSRMTGISDATISQLFAGKYPGKQDEMLRKVAAATNYQPKEWQLLTTPNLRTTHKVCEDAQKNSRLMALFAETGMGKTASLLHYNSVTANSYYVQVDVLMKPKDMLKAIQRAIGSDHEGTIVERAEDIIERLLRKEKPLLIIDDIGKLKEHPKCFYLIQLLYDRTFGRCGFVLSGTKAFPSFIQRQASRDTMGFRELKRRISYWQPLKDKVESRFIAAVAASAGITLPSAIDYMGKVCYNYGDVRELITNYNCYRSTHGDIAEDEQQQVISSLMFSHLSLN